MYNLQKADPEDLGREKHNNNNKTTTTTTAKGN